MVPTDHVFSIFKSDLTRKAAEPYCFRVNALLLPPARDFPGPDSQFKNEENGVYQSQFISSTFWWKFHENSNKNTKVTDAWNFA